MVEVGVDGPRECSPAVLENLKSPNWCTGKCRQRVKLHTFRAIRTCLHNACRYSSRLNYVVLAFIIWVLRCDGIAAQVPGYWLDSNTNKWRTIYPERHWICRSERVNVHDNFSLQREFKLRTSNKGEKTKHLPFCSPGGRPFFGRH